MNIVFFFHPRLLVRLERMQLCVWLCARLCLRVKLPKTQGERSLTNFICALYFVCVQVLGFCTGEYVCACCWYLCACKRCDVLGGCCFSQVLPLICYITALSMSCQLGNLATTPECTREKPPDNNACLGPIYQGDFSPLPLIPLELSKRERKNKKRKHTHTKKERARAREKEDFLQICSFCP